MRQLNGIDVMKIPYSSELQGQIMRDFFQRVFRELQQQGVPAQINKGVWKQEQQDIIRGIMQHVQAGYSVEAIKNDPALVNTPFHEALKDGVTRDFLDFLGLLRTWFINASCPGAAQVGIRLKEL